jgi:hypothetical protein
MTCSKGLAKRGEAGAKKRAERERPAIKIFILKATNNLWNELGQTALQRRKGVVKDGKTRLNAF